MNTKTGIRIFRMHMKNFSVRYIRVFRFLWYTIRKDVMVFSLIILLRVILILVRKTAITLYSAAMKVIWIITTLQVIPWQKSLAIIPI